MKNVMKLSLLGLALTIGAESAASATMARVMTRGSKLVNLASSHKLATAGILVGGLFALDAFSAKAMPHVSHYAKLGKAKASHWNAMRQWRKAEKVRKVAYDANQNTNDITRKQAFLDAQAKEKAASDVVDARLVTLDAIRAENVQRTSLRTTRAVSAAGSKVAAGANWARSKVPAFRKSAAKQG